MEIKVVIKLDGGKEIELTGSELKEFFDAEEAT